MTQKCKNWKWPLVFSNPNISASTCPKLKIKDSFEILRTGRFQDCPYFLDFVKIWWRYCQKTKLCTFFVDTVYLADIHTAISDIDTQILEWHLTARQHSNIFQIFIQNAHIRLYEDVSVWSSGNTSSSVR